VLSLALARHTDTAAGAESSKVHPLCGKQARKKSKLTATKQAKAKRRVVVQRTAPQECCAKAGSQQAAAGSVPPNLTNQPTMDSQGLVYNSKQRLQQRDACMAVCKRWNGEGGRQASRTCTAVSPHTRVRGVTHVPKESISQPIGRGTQAKVQCPLGLPLAANFAR
jgi:hypothetical protein